jgi:hypothetical protein
MLWYQIIWVYFAVWALIWWLCVPGVVMAVSTAVRVWLRRYVSLIRRPCLAIVTRRRPLRGRSLMFPNSTRRPCRRWTVVWWTPRAVATSCWVAPWRSIVTARLRSSLLKRGILQQHFSYEMTTGFVKWVLWLPVIFNFIDFRYAVFAVAWQTCNLQTESTARNALTLWFKCTE